jgi:hypothetical protein
MGEEREEGVFTEAQALSLQGLGRKRQLRVADTSR